MTNRDVPDGKVASAGAAATLARLVATEVIGPETRGRRPVASGRARPRPRRPVSDLVSDQRR
jgi:hypothetical protein